MKGICLANPVIHKKVKPFRLYILNGFIFFMFREKLAISKSI